MRLSRLPCGPGRIAGGTHGNGEAIRSGSSRSSSGRHARRWREKEVSPTAFAAERFRSPILRNTMTHDDPRMVLGIPPEAGDEEIRAAYLRKVKKYPPDRAPQEFEKIRDAYETLRDP